MTLEVELDANLSGGGDFYHACITRVLEAAAVAAHHPPAAVCELNEAGFESAAWRMHAELGAADPVALNRMLELFGF